jgi:hypothetical protein
MLWGTENPFDHRVMRLVESNDSGIRLRKMVGLSQLRAASFVHSERHAGASNGIG